MAPLALIAKQKILWPYDASYDHKLFTFSASVTDVQHNEVIIKKIKDKGDEEQVE